MKGRRRKPYIVKSLISTPPDTFSPFNLEFLNAHKETIKIKSDVLKDLDMSFMAQSGKSKLHPLEIVQAYFDLLQINTIQFYQVDHVSPKLFMLGLMLLKNSHSFAERVAINNGTLTSMSNLKLIRDHIEQIAKVYNIKYSDLPDMTDSIGINTN